MSTLPTNDGMRGRMDPIRRRRVLRCGHVPFTTCGKSSASSSHVSRGFASPAVLALIGVFCISGGVACANKAHTVRAHALLSSLEDDSPQRGEGGDSGSTEALNEAVDARTFYRQVAATLATQPCGVRALMASRSTLYGADVETDLSEIARLAARLCDDDITSVRVDFDALGMPTIEGSARGFIMGASQTFVFESFESFRMTGRLTPQAPDDRPHCLEDVEMQPIGRLNLATSMAIEVETSDASPVALVSRGDDDDDECFDGFEKDRSFVASTLPAGYVEIYGVPTSSDRLPDVHVRPVPYGSSGGRMVWRDGEEISVPVTVGPFTRAAADISIDYYCVGYVGAEPSLVVDVLQPRYGFAYVTSMSDPVLLIRGPNGVTCNDDYDGLNPGIWQMFEEGRYEFFVGSYGYEARFDAQLHLE